MQSCSLLCHCRNCHNSHGKKPPEEQNHTPLKRKRPMHENQEILLKGRKTNKFMQEAGEVVLKGTTSDFEYLVLCSIIDNLLEKPYDWIEWKSVDLQIVGNTYKYVQGFAKVVKMELPLFERTHEEILKLINQTAFKFQVVSTFKQ